MIKVAVSNRNSKWTWWNCSVLDCLRLCFFCLLWERAIFEPKRILDKKRPNYSNNCPYLTKYSYTPTPTHSPCWCGHVDTLVSSNPTYWLLGPKVNCYRHASRWNQVYYHVLGIFHVTMFSESVVFTWNRCFYPTTSAAHPASVLIVHPRDIKILRLDSEKEKNKNRERITPVLHCPQNKKMRYGPYRQIV